MASVLGLDVKHGVKFVTLAHNTIRGAAGGSVLNAEMVVRMGLA